MRLTVCVAFECGNTAVNPLYLVDHAMGDLNESLWRETLPQLSLGAKCRRKEVPIAPSSRRRQLCVQWENG